MGGVGERGVALEQGWEARLGGSGLKVLGGWSRVPLPGSSEGPCSSGWPWSEDAVFLPESFSEEEVGADPRQLGGAEGPGGEEEPWTLRAGFSVSRRLFPRVRVRVRVLCRIPSSSSRLWGHGAYSWFKAHFSLGGALLP